MGVGFGQGELGVAVVGGDGAQGLRLEQRVEHEDGVQVRVDQDPRVALLDDQVEDGLVLLFPHHIEDL